jgi:hypothetical protein
MVASLVKAISAGGLSDMSKETKTETVEIDGRWLRVGDKEYALPKGYDWRLIDDLEHDADKGLVVFLTLIKTMGW